MASLAIEMESAQQTIRASVLHGVKDLRVEDRILSPPGPGHLQVSVRATGLCGSDLHYYNHYRNGDIIVREPLSLGHESAGVVAAIGEGVTGFEIGEKVALEVGLPCGECQRCKEGRYNICKQMKFRSSAKGFPHAQGTLQDRINHPAEWCHKLPKDMPLDYGALLEPLAVAIHAIRRSQMAYSSRVLIFGAGAVGLLCAAMAKISGAGKVVIADIDSGRTDFAVKHRFADLGFAVNSKRGSNTEEDLEIATGNAQSISKSADVEEFDLSFECTGVPSCLQAAIYATRPGGRVMIIGMGTPIQTLPISAAALREVDLTGVFRYANTYPAGIEVLNKKEEGSPEFSAIVTHRFAGLDHAPEAFAMAGRSKDDKGNLVLKVLLEMDEKM